MNVKSIVRRLAYTALSLSLLTITSCGSNQSDERYSLIPMPNELKAASGEFEIKESVSFSISSQWADSCNTIVSQFADQLKMVGAINQYQTFFSDSTSIPSTGIIIAYDQSLKHEGYRLSVEKKRILIKSSSRNGVFFALQTIKQLLPIEIFGKESVRNIAWKVPCVEINDAPRFGYRGQHIDVARHFFDINQMKKILDVMALHKLNVLHWHLTDDQGWRIEIKKYPKLTEIGSIRHKTMIRKEWENYDTTTYGGFYTQEQIKEIVQYAHDRCIDVIPEIDLPGHMMAALAAYPNLGCTGGPYEVSGQWGVRDDVLCPGNDATFTFLEGVLSEVIELFPSKYIHVGGDECPKIRWEKCPKCQARIKKEGLKGDDKHKSEFYLQSYVMERVETFLNSHSKQSIGWDEILEGKLSPNATVMSWRGMEGGIEAARLHHPVIMTPNTHLYFDYYQTLDTPNEPLAIGGFVPIEKVYSLDPIPAELNEKERSYIIGVQANLWSEYIVSNEHQEYMLLPRMAALSEIQWTQVEHKNWDRFLNSLNRYTKIYDKMGLNYGKHIFEITAATSIDSLTNSVVVTLKTQGDAPMYYTIDGSEPTEKSTKYTNPVQINKSCHFKAIVKRGDMKTRTFTREFKFNKATGKAVTLNSKPTAKYTFTGSTVLVDGVRGDFNYSSGFWLGYLEENVDLIINFGEPTTASSVKIGAMVQLGEWVFGPSKISVWTFENGEFIPKGTTDIALATADTKDGIYEYECAFPQTETSKLRILINTTSSIPEWHGARKLKGHLFLDELIVE